MTIDTLWLTRLWMKHLFLLSRVWFYQTKLCFTLGCYTYTIRYFDAMHPKGYSVMRRTSKIWYSLIQFVQSWRSRLTLHQYDKMPIGTFYKYISFIVTLKDFQMIVGQLCGCSKCIVNHLFSLLVDVVWLSWLTEQRELSLCFW